VSKTLTLTKKDMKALHAYFDEGPPLAGDLATMYAKLERLSETQSKTAKFLLQLADLLDDDEEFCASLTKALNEGRGPTFLRIAADMDGVCG
jgi:hypothetical protein